MPENDKQIAERTEPQSRRLTRWGWLFVILVILGIAAGLVSLWMLEKVTDEVLGAFVGITIALLLSAAMLNYLGDNTRLVAERLLQFLAPTASSLLLSSSSSRVTYRLDADELRRLVRRLQSRAPASTVVALTDADRDAIVASVTSEVRAHLSDDLLREAEARFGATAAKTNRLLELRALGERTKERLLDEVVALSRRSNLNLIIGIITTVAAVALLGYIVLSGSIDGSDWRTLLPGYVLRLSLVVFIEIFAFFFLRMYQLNLQEIKYFQNELTSIEAKFIALEAAIAEGDAESTRTLIAQLGSVERNQILQQGQSTVELERLRLENSTLKEVLGTLGKLIPNQQK